jgi:hypothetical protein
LKRAIDRIAPEDVGLCVEPILLEYLVAAWAANAIVYEVTSRIEGTGRWRLIVAPEKVTFGVKRGLAECFTDLLVATDFGSREIREKLIQVGEASLGDSAAVEKLKRFADDTISPDTGSPGLDRLLCVAAASLVKKLI